MSLLMPRGNLQEGDLSFRERVSSERIIVQQEAFVFMGFPKGEPEQKQQRVGTPERRTKHCSLLVLYFLVSEPPNLSFWKTKTKIKGCGGLRSPDEKKQPDY